MDLNKAAGRTFNDLMQYPVFPFVLSNYRQIINMKKFYPIMFKSMMKHFARFSGNSQFFS